MLKRVLVISLSSLAIGFAVQPVALADGLNSMMRFNPRMAESFGQQVLPPPQNFHRGNGHYYIPQLPHYAVRSHRRHSRYNRGRRLRFDRHHSGPGFYFGR